MKSLAPALLASDRLCACLLVIRKDGIADAFTSADVDIDVEITVDGSPRTDTYRASAGFGVSNLVSQVSLAVDNMEITVLPDETTFPEVDILAGRWDRARFWLFETDYTDPSVGINLLKRGTTGEADTLRSANRFEFRGLKQALQQPLGEVTTKTCRARLGDERCKVDLAPWTHSYLITAVTSRREFTCAAAVQADEYFKEGRALSTDAANEGYEQKVKTFAGGVFTLALPMPFDVEVGDAFTFVAGCQKRLLDDCRDKFDNVLNFQGEPHIPGPDLLTADPEIGD